MGSHGTTWDHRDHPTSGLALRVVGQKQREYHELDHNIVINTTVLSSMIPVECHRHTIMHGITRDHTGSHGITGVITGVTAHSSSIRIVGMISLT